MNKLSEVLQGRVLNIRASRTSAYGKMLVVCNQVVIGELVVNEVYLRRNSHSIFFHVVVAKIY